MEGAVRISESQAAPEKFWLSSVHIEPEVRLALDPFWWRTAGSGH
jgi:hypothetical protein